MAELNQIDRCVFFVDGKEALENCKLIIELAVYS